MRGLSGVLAFGAGVAALLLTGVVVTEGASQWIEFSLFIGIPAGIIAGITVGVLVYLNLGASAPNTRKRIARAAGGAGVVFLVGLLVGAGVLDFPIVTSLLVASGLGVLGGVVLYLRDPSD